MLGKQPTNSINLLVPSRCSLLPCAYVYWNVLVFPLPYSIKTGQRRRLGSFPCRQLLPLCLYHFVGSHLDCSGGTEFSPLPSLRFQVPPHCFLVLSRGAVSLSYLCPCCFLCLASISAGAKSTQPTGLQSKLPSRELTPCPNPALSVLFKPHVFLNVVEVQ